MRHWLPDRRHSVHVSKSESNGIRGAATWGEKCTVFGEMEWKSEEYSTCMEELMVAFSSYFFLVWGLWEIYFLMLGDYIFKSAMCSM